MILKTITLDVWRSNREQVLVQQGETGSRFLYIYIQNAGQPVDLTGTSVTLFCTKPDGTTIYIGCTVEDSTAGLVQLPITRQMCAAAGELRDVELRVWGAAGCILKVFGLQIKVVDTEEYTAQVESTDDFSALQQVMMTHAAGEAHLNNRSNPHRVTAAQVGAAAAEEVAALTARMDAFTVLPDGSTAGDAELADIRLGWDGTTYHNAGASVRGQASALHQRIAVLEQMSVQKLGTFKQVFFQNSAVTGSAETDAAGNVCLTYTKTGAGYFYARHLLDAYENLAGQTLQVHVENTGPTPLYGIEVLLAASPDWSDGTRLNIYPIVRLDSGCCTTITARIPENNAAWAGRLVYMLLRDDIAGESWPNNLNRANALRYFISAPIANPFGVPMAAYAAEAAALTGFNPAEYCTRAELDGLLADRFAVCWGDSLTAQGGWTEVLAERLGIPVYNAGTGGESSWTIAARQGADVMEVAGVTIPAAAEPVVLADYAAGFSTQLGHTVRPLLQGGGDHVNPVVIGGVAGTLAWTGADPTDSNGTWTFTRSTPGTALELRRPTAIRTAFDRTRNNPHLMVIFMGQNDGDFEVNTLIRCHKQMMDHAHARHTLILGLSSGTAEERAAYEAAMTEEFGRRFVSLRAYLSAYGLADAGLTATEEDAAAMAEGRVPPQLLADGVHFTDACKQVIGELVYRTCVELNAAE